MKNETNVIRNGISDSVREFFNVGKVKRLFRVGTEMFNALQPFVEKQTPLNALRSAFHMGKVIIDDLEVWPDDYFDDSWDAPYPQDFNKILLRALHGKPYKIVRTSDESLCIHIVQLEDVKLGYIFNTKNNYVPTIYVQANKIERTKELVKKELWRILKDDNVVLRYDRRKNSHTDNDALSLDADDAFRPMPSKIADQYSAYLKKCIDAGIPRSVMLYGPPGTGKSTLARSIVDSLKMRSFRIRVEDIGSLESASVFEAISIFEPDAVILDDFDRSNAQASLLETLEFFQRHVKLVIATVNDRHRLDEAILRPGRFDELINVKQLDDDVIKTVLGEEFKDAFDIVKTWPIAFTQEYVKRRRFMTPEEAVETTRELAQRVKSISRYGDEDEDSESSDVDKVLDKNAAETRLNENAQKKKKIFSNSLDDFKKSFGKRKKHRV